MKRTALLTICAVALALSTPTMADVYRWIDDNGAVKYGDIPPKDRKYTLVEKTSKTKDAKPNTVSKATDFAGNAKAARDASMTPAEKRKLAKQKKLNCERYNDKLTVLKNSRRVRVLDEGSSEERFMSDAEKAEAISALEASVKGCKK